MEYIIVLGNAIDGLSFYGPFASADDALQAAEQSEFYASEFHVTHLESPLRLENGE